jgi:hypothetical protein
MTVCRYETAWNVMVSWEVQTNLWYPPQSTYEAECGIYQNRCQRRVRGTFLVYFCILHAFDFVQWACRYYLPALEFSKLQITNESNERQRWSHQRRQRECYKLSTNFELVFIIISLVSRLVAWLWGKNSGQGKASALTRPSLVQSELPANAFHSYRIYARNSYTIKWWCRGWNHQFSLRKKRHGCAFCHLSLMWPLC